MVDGNIPTGWLMVDGKKSNDCWFCGKISNRLLARYQRVSELMEKKHFFMVDGNIPTGWLLVDGKKSVDCWFCGKISIRLLVRYPRVG